MGQKTNPNGFRLVTTKKHLSEWYSGISDRSAVIKGYDFMKKGETIPKP